MRYCFPKAFLSEIRAYDLFFMDLHLATKHSSLHKSITVITAARFQENVTEGN